jgi:hypothetical protein
MYISIIRQMIQRFKEGTLNCFPKIHYSQWGEDLFLKEYFEKRTGFYVDIGAYHPFRFSNTALLYSAGWNGLNIDARPGSKKLFDFWRKRDINIEAMIGNGEFVHYEKRKDGSLNGIGNTGDMVKTRRVMEILRENIPNDQKIGLLTIDLEGLNFQALEQIDFDVYRPEIIIIERDGDDAVLNESMSGKKYFLIAKTLGNNIYKAM